jgi:transposase
MAGIHKPYPSDVNDEKWSRVLPYLTLMGEGAPQRQHSLREPFNGPRYVIRYGIAWRAMPNDLPPWFAVYQQSQRWLAAGVFEALAHDLRALLRVASGRPAELTAAIIGVAHCARRRRAARALDMTAASANVARNSIGRSIRWDISWRRMSPRRMWMTSGRSKRKAPNSASSNAPMRKKGFVLLPKRWVVEISFAWATRCRRLIKDYERYAETLAGLHVVAFACRMLKRATDLMLQSAKHPLGRGILAMLVLETKILIKYKELGT